MPAKALSRPEIKKSRKVVNGAAAKSVPGARVRMTPMTKKAMA